MEKLRKFLAAISALIACVGMTSCSSENDLPGNETEQEFYTVRLGWGGELDVTYEPLTRADATDDLYGIQVYSTPDIELEDGEEITWTPYAYGLFDNTDISINLLKGYKYKFVATMIVDGKNKLDTYIVETYEAGYRLPFYVENMPNGICPLANEFDYQSSSSFCLSNLSDATTFLQGGILVTRANVKRYYGELDNYVPSNENTQAKIPMKFTCFGAKFVAKGKAAESGTLKIQLEGAPVLNLTPTTEQHFISDIFTFANLYNAWKTDNYSETIAVSISWYKEDGITIPLGTHNITYKRNKTTIVNIEVDDEGLESGVGFEFEDTDMPEEETETTIKDGEIVETEVGT